MQKGASLCADGLRRLQNMKLLLFSRGFNIFFGGITTKKKSKDKSVKYNKVTQKKGKSKSSQIMWAHFFFRLLLSNDFFSFILSLFPYGPNRGMWQKGRTSAWDTRLSLQAHHQLSSEYCGLWRKEEGGNLFFFGFYVRPIGPLSYFPLKLCREVRRKDILQKRNWDRIMSWVNERASEWRKVAAGKYWVNFVGYPLLALPLMWLLGIIGFSVAKYYELEEKKTFF